VVDGKCQPQPCQTVALDELEALDFAQVTQRRRKGAFVVGPDGRPRFWAAFRIYMVRFGVSRRSAFRHIRAGTLPSTERRMGRDGKLYPVHLRK
jgi:hypothetical protein